MSHHFTQHSEPHYSSRNNWLRASVLGANDGLISTASLMMGLAAARPETTVILLTGLAALVGGAISMAAGEYVSVSSQADTERADLSKEAYELQHNAERELDELTVIYQQRGLDQPLARQVAEALTRHDALAAHARDEIGLHPDGAARPMQAALFSASAFCSGAVLPVSVSVLCPSDALVAALAATTLAGLALLGWLSAKLGGAPVRPALFRIVLWGVAAMAATAMIGSLFGVKV